MWDGTVDVNWAKEHHSQWAAQKAAKEQAGAPAGGKMQPAE